MGVRAIFQLATPWTEDEIFDVGYEQTADVMMLTHLNHKPQELIRYDHDRWTLADAVFAATSFPPTNASFTVTAANGNTGTGYIATGYDYVITNIDAATGQESLPTVVKSATSDLTLKGNQINLAWTAPTGSERINVYRKGGGAFGYVGTSDTGTFTDDNIDPDFSQSYPREKDPFPTDQDQPATVAFWQQRAAYGRTLNKPNGIFTSQSANLFNFNASQPVVASDATNFAVNGRRVNAVVHLVPLKSLIVFTTDTVFSISGGANGEAFSPTTINVSPEGYRAASRVRPIVIDDIIMYGTAKGCSLRTLGYQFQTDGYKGNDLTVFVPHFFRGVSMVDMNWSEFPNGTVNVICNDGDVRALTWQQEQDVWGWSKLHTDGVLESCCTVSENGEDVSYFIVRREIDGVQKRYLEYSATPNWPDVAHAIYLDSARTYDGEPASHFSGLKHLEGKAVTVLADGAVYLGKYTVVNGALDAALPVPASVVAIGLSYESWIRTLRLDAPTQEGSSNGQPQVLAGASVHVLRSRGLEIGTGKNLPPGQFEPATSDDEIAGDIFEAKTRDGEPMGTPTELFSGDLWVDLESSDWRDASVVVRQRYPLPMMVVGITPEAVAGD